MIKFPNKTSPNPHLPRKWEIKARNYLKISGWNRKWSCRGGDDSCPTTASKVHLQHKHWGKNPCDVSWEATINKNLKEEKEHEFLKENKGKIYSAFCADCTEYKSTVQHLLPCSRGAWDANVAQDLCSAGAEMWQSQHWFALSLFSLEGWARKCLQRTAVQKKNCALIKKLNLFLTLARSFVALASRRWKSERDLGFHGRVISISVHGIFTSGLHLCGCSLIMSLWAKPLGPANVTKIHIKSLLL